MEGWVPLMDIFMNSPCPETEASLWFQQSFKPSSSNSTSLSTSSFLSLLTKPTDILLLDSSSPSSYSPSKTPNTKKILWMQTLPNVIQARILWFLAYDHARFSKRDLCKLARDILTELSEIDFWVKRAARQLLDVVSDTNYEWVSCLSMDSEEQKLDEDFGSVPDWLKDAANVSDLVLPWLPVSFDEFNVRVLSGTCEDDEDLMIDAEEGEAENLDEIGKEVKAPHPKIDAMTAEIEEMAACLKSRMLNFESVSEAAGLANEIRELCIRSGADPLAVLAMIEPWHADDETVSVLLSHLSEGSEDELGWISYILCSTILPKFLILEEPASRVLVSATVDYCKMHQRATVYALLFPLVLRKEGINSPICDVITRIVRECLHPAHVSAFFQKLLCGDEDECKLTCLRCHQSLISNELVWTEHLFNLFQNILNHNVHLTQDSVDLLICRAQESAERFSTSLKFGNFLLCLVTKCAPSLQRHKILLTDAVKHTKTFVTKSILAKLASLEQCLMHQ